MVPKGEDAPKASDFVHWLELIADWAAPGSSADRIRGHLKAVSKSTWELVGWLTHAKNAARTDGVIAVEAVQHTLGQFGMAIMRKENGEPGRCPKCSSYRLTQDYRPELGPEHSTVTRCEACEWEDLPDDLDLSVLPNRDLSRPTRLEDFLDVGPPEDE